MKLKWRISLIIVHLVGLGLGIVLWRLEKGHVVVTPLRSQSDTVAAAPNSKVEFHYRIHNASWQYVDGVRLDLGCQCQVIKSPPAKLRPGESSEFAFWIRTPDAGVVTQTVVVRAKSGTPLAILTPTAQVNSDPPVLLGGHREALLACVEGQSGDHSMLIHTTELRREQPWISGIEFIPPEIAHYERMSVQDLAHLDPTLCHRAYRFTVRTDLPPGSHQGQFRLLFRSNGRSEKQNQEGQLNVRVLEQISVLPNPLRIHRNGAQSNAPYTIVIVQRNDVPQPVEVDTYDPQTLEIRQATEKAGRIAKFQLIPTDIPDESRTEVRFRTKDGKVAILSVLIGPS